MPIEVIWVEIGHDGYITGEFMEDVSHEATYFDDKNPHCLIVLLDMHERCRH